MASAEPYVCPDLSVGETQNDCPWAAVARELVAAAEKGEATMSKLKALLPDLYRRIQLDSGKQTLKSLWGRSSNFDELAKATTVHPAIIDALSGFFAVPAPKDNVVHAGLEHTYGYLFSLLKTSFGYKRDRWVSGKIETGLDLEKGVLGPLPQEGTLFTNVTYFAGRVAFSKDPKELATIKKMKNVAQGIRSYSFEELKTIRLIETVSIPEGEKSRTVVLRTDLVPFAHATPENAYLLVYSVVDPDLRGPKLITAFQVDQAFGDRVKATELGEEKPVQSRYNAIVRGLTGGKTLSGKKELVQESQSEQQ
jgi:hypothetical protein